MACGEGVVGDDEGDAEQPVLGQLQQEQRGEGGHHGARQREARAGLGIRSDTPPMCRGGTKVVQEIWVDPTREI